MLGREKAAGVDLVLGDGTVSGRHCSVQVGRKGEAGLITDLGSTNGTAVNGRDVGRNGKAKLRAGDTIQLGDVVMMIEFQDDEPEEPEPEPEPLWVRRTQASRGRGGRGRGARAHSPRCTAGRLRR